LTTNAPNCTGSSVAAGVGVATAVVVVVEAAGVDGLVACAKATPVMPRARIEHAANRCSAVKGPG
jgi:hypothetical protein